jgi:hypothetical protein
VNDLYFLRSETILSLLGSREQLRAKLAEFRDVRLHQAFDTLSFHRALNAKQRWRVAPLSGHQETELLAKGNHLHMVFGSLALGLARLAASLNSVSGLKTLELTKDVNADELLTWINECIDGQGDEGHAVLVVPASRLRFVHDSGQLASAMDAVAQRLKVRRANTRHTRVLVAVDPVATVRWLEAGHVKYASLEDSVASPVFLRRWSDETMKRWLLSLSLTRSASELEVIRARTGHWPLLLEECVAPLRDRKGIESLELRLEAVDQHQGEALRTLLGLEALELPSPVSRAARTLAATLAELQGYGQPIGETLLQVLAGVDAAIAGDALELLRRLDFLDISAEGIQLAPLVADALTP